MCGRLDCYLQAFSTLHKARDVKRGSAGTNFQAPQKPLLLLSVLDGIASGLIKRNFIELSAELETSFGAYCSRLAPGDVSISMAQPFYDMGGEGFWSLIAEPGVTHQDGLVFNSVDELRRSYLGARFADDLYPLLLMKSSREKLRSLLKTTYFLKEN